MLHTQEAVKKMGMAACQAEIILQAEVTQQ